MRCVGLGVGVAALSLCLGMGGTAFAVEDIYTNGPLRVDLGVETGASIVASPGANFGSGRVDVTSGANTGDTIFGETYVRPTLGFKLSVAPDTEIYGLVAGVAQATLGEGDQAGYTNSGSADVALDQLYFGFRHNANGGKDAGGWTYDLSFGRQKVQIGDGFLVWDGNFDSTRDGAYWAAPRQAFDRAVTFKAENANWALTGFAMESDGDTGKTGFAGGDLAYTADFGTVGILGGSVIGTDAANSLDRAGLNVVSVRARNIKTPIENLTLAGEYAYEFGSSDSEGDRDAHGWFAQIAYNFANVTWTPTISYRYSRFSGDDNPKDGVARAFDPLFFGAGGGWGTWFQGEVTGEYLLFNSNEIAHEVKLTFAPTEQITWGVMYYHFELDKPWYYGTPVTSTSFANEVNAFVDWTVNDNLYVGAVAGVAFPGTAAKEVFGNDANGVIEALLIYTY